MGLSGCANEVRFFAMRSILHVDMDCFYAAIEVRDHPALRGKPVAVGGRERGVLTTANYEARKFGCRSAMPTFKALRLCPELVVMPTRFEVYREESRKIKAIFDEYTHLVEPLSLDEAYLDVTNHGQEGALIASEIRKRIEASTGLTASAGVAPNKLLAKIASDWRKPDGQFEITPQEVEEFMEHLPVRRLHGVGRKTEAKLASVQVLTCGDLQRVSKFELADLFGSWGAELHALCRGIDERPVRIDRIRKSVSSETTLKEDIEDFPLLIEVMDKLRSRVERDLAAKHGERTVRSLVVKLKFSDFTQTTAERAPEAAPDQDGERQLIEAEICRDLLAEAWRRGDGKGVRLVGVGVRFADPGSRSQLQFEL